MTKKDTSERPAHRSWRVLDAEFERSVFSLKDLPDEQVPEIAFVGRSNAGKSSVLNSLCDRNALARVSKTPGRTQAINLFRVRLRAEDSVLQAEQSGEAMQEWTLRFADLPGYGYAKVSEAMRESWRRMLGDYLLERAQLRLIVLVHDIRRPLAEEELWFFQTALPPTVLVLSKRDKLSKNEVASALQDCKKRLGQQEIIPISALKKGDAGIQTLLAAIGAIAEES